MTSRAVPDIALPRVWSAPKWSTSFGFEIVDMMRHYRRPLDPWQAWVVINGLGGTKHPDLKEWDWAADRCGCWVPRQNGKGDIIMALELGWLFLLAEPLILHSAHLYPTAQESFLRIQGFVQEIPDMDSKVRRYWNANGEQGIELTRNRKKSVSPRLRFMARTKRAGRGFSAGKLVLDEGQELDADLMRVIMPVMSAQKNAQMWLFGTPPMDDTAWIYNVKRAGEGKAQRLFWADWGMKYVDLDVARNRSRLGDPRVWRSTNPAMDVGRITERAIQGELDIMGPTVAFATERCGMWLPERVVDETENLSISKTAWATSAEPTAVRPQQVAFAFYVTRNRNHHTIMYAGKSPEGKWIIGVVRHQPGTSGLTDKLRDLRDEWNPIAITVDARSESTLDDLATVGIRESADPDSPSRGDLVVPTSVDVATAYGLLVDAANNGHLVHYDEAPLNKAITAPPRALSGGSTWDHTKGVNVGPAVAAGLAMWAYQERFELVTQKREYDPLANIW